MRAFLFVLITLFAIDGSAQSRAVMSPFNEATRSATAGDFERALSAYQTALAAAGAETVGTGFLMRLHYDLGVCHYQLGRSAEAITEFERAIEISRGTYPRALYAMGMAETDLANWARARTAFVRALEIDNTNGEYWFDLAVAYIGEKDLERAEIAFQRSIDYHTVDVSLSHNNLGVILAWRGEYPRARKEFETATKLSGRRLAEVEQNLEYCRLLERGGAAPATPDAFTVNSRVNQRR